MLRGSGRNILLLAHGKADEDSAYKHRIGLIAQALIAADFHVTLLWFYPVQRFLKKQSFHMFRSTKSVIAVPVPPLYGLRWVSILTRCWCSLITKFVNRYINACAIHAENSICGGFVHAPRTGSVLVVDMHGDFPAELEMVGAPRWRIDLARSDERKALECSTAAIYVTQFLQDSCLSKCQDPPKFSTVVPCAVNVEHFKLSADSREMIRKRLDLGNRKVFCYAGGVATWQCIDEMISLVVSLRKKDPDIFFLFLTKGDLSPFQTRLECIGALGEDYLSLAVQHNEVSDYLNAADFGFLLRANNMVNLVSSPTKLGEYLASGVPVITTRYAGNASTIVPQSGCGFVLDDVIVADHQLQELLTFVNKTMDARKEVASKCNSAAVKYLSWDTGSKRIANLYNDILQRT